MTLTELKRLVDFAFDQHNGSQGFGSDNVYIKVVDNPANPQKLFDVQQLSFNINNSARVPVIAIFPDSIVEEHSVNVQDTSKGHLAEVAEVSAVSEDPAPKRRGRPAKPKIAKEPRPPGRPKKIQEPTELTDLTELTESEPLEEVKQESYGMFLGEHKEIEQLKEKEFTEDAIKVS